MQYAAIYICQQSGRVVNRKRTQKNQACLGYYVALLVSFFFNVSLGAKSTYIKKYWQGEDSAACLLFDLLPRTHVWHDAIRQFAKNRGLTGCQQSFMRATRQGGGTLPCRPTSCGRLGCLRCLSAMACSTSCTTHSPCFQTAEPLPHQQSCCCFSK